MSQDAKVVWNAFTWRLTVFGGEQKKRRRGCFSTIGPRKDTGITTLPFPIIYQDMFRVDAFVAGWCFGNVVFFCVFFFP